MLTAQKSAHCTGKLYWAFFEIYVGNPYKYESSRNLVVVFGILAFIVGCREFEYRSRYQLS